MGTAGRLWASSAVCGDSQAAMGAMGALAAMNAIERSARPEPLPPDGGGRKGLLDEHDGDVRDDRVDQARGGTEQTLLDHRRLVAEMLPVLLRQHPADVRRQL